MYIIFDPEKLVDTCRTEDGRGFEAQKKKSAVRH